MRLLIESRPKPPAPTREPPKPKPEEKLAEQKPQGSAEGRGDEAGDRRSLSPPPAKDRRSRRSRAFSRSARSSPALQEDQALARLGSQAQINNSGDSGPVERAMLTTNAPGSSGGINLASLSRGVGGNGGNGGMAGVQVTRVTSGIGGIGKPGADRPLSGDGVGPSRTDEEIQIVFDRYKAALYRLYNKELRKDPTLRGQMVLQSDDRAGRQRLAVRAASVGHECAGAVRASRRSREDDQLRREGRRPRDHDSLSDRFPPGRLTIKSTHIYELF